MSWGELVESEGKDQVARHPEAFIHVNTTLLALNLHSVKYKHLQHTVWWILTCIHLCDPYHKEHFHQLRMFFALFLIIVSLFPPKSTSILNFYHYCDEFCFLLKFHTSGIIHYVLFFIWLLWLSIIFLRSIYATAIFIVIIYC